MAKYRYFFVILLATLFIPKVVFGLAGWAEFEHVYYYTNDVFIESNEPSDSCPDGFDGHQDCLILFKGSEDDRKLLDNLPLLTEINIPQSDNLKYILGRDQGNGNWLIYNFNESKVVFTNQDKKNVLKEWQRFGNGEDKFIKVGNLDKYFTETEKSKKQYNEHSKFAKEIGETFLITVSIPIIIGVIIVIFAFFAPKIKKYFKRRS